MTFWGIEVKPGKPYTHQYNKDGGRLHISQAALSYGGGTSTKKSVVQCNVGKSRPVVLCSLLPDKVETCPLDLEFQEDEEVIFSVLGPQSIYLTGYYLNRSRHHLNRYDDDTDSYGEDIAETESDPPRDSDEDVYDKDDSFINDGDPGEHSPSPQPKTKSGGSTTERKEKCNSRRKRLKKKYQISDSDEDKDASQRRTTMKESSIDLNLDIEDEDACLISSLFKSKTLVKNEKVEKTSTTKRAEDHKQEKAVEDGGRVTYSKRKIDTVIEESISRKQDQPCNPLLPSDDDGNRNRGTPKKKKNKKKEIVDLGNNLEDRIRIDQDQPIVNCKSDVYKENGQCKEIEIKSMGEELTVGDEMHRKLPNNEMTVIDSHIIGDCEKLKKKEKANKHKHTFTEVDDSKDLESKEPYLQIKELVPIISSSQESNANLEDQKKVIDSHIIGDCEKLKKKEKANKHKHTFTEVDDSKDLESKEPYLQIKELDPIISSSQESNANLEDQNGKLKKKKKKKKKGDKNENVITEDDDSKPLQLKEPFLENMKVNPVVDVQESSAQPQNENRKLKKKHKKGDKDKATMTGAGVSEPLQSKDPRLESMELDQQFDNDQRSNADLQNERIHGLEVDEVLHENDIRVKRKTKGKRKSHEGDTTHIQIN